MLLGNWAVVVDYALNRPVYRERHLSWMRATERLWADPPLESLGTSSNRSGKT